MAKKKRSYTDEFKQEAMRLVHVQGLTVARVGHDPGVDRSVVGARVQKADAGEASSSSLAGESALHDEIRRLRKELAVVREDREILKRAAAFFAKESQ